MLLHEPTICFGAATSQTNSFEAVARGFGLSVEGLWQFIERGLGPKPTRQGRAFQTVVFRDQSINAWFRRRWMSVEREVLAKLQRQFPAEFLTKRT